MTRTVPQCTFSVRQVVCAKSQGMGPFYGQYSLKYRGRKPDLSQEVIGAEDRLNVGGDFG